MLSFNCSKIIHYCEGVGRGQFVLREFQGTVKHLTSQNFFQIGKFFGIKIVKTLLNVLGFNLTQIIWNRIYRWINRGTKVFPNTSSWLEVESKPFSVMKDEMEWTRDKFDSVIIFLNYEIEICKSYVNHQCTYLKKVDASIIFVINRLMLNVN